MGELSSRIRAAWGDTRANPWKGLGLRERRRLVRLTRCGKRITDPKDAMHVREYIFWNRRFRRRFFLAAGLLWAIILVPDVIGFFVGHPLPTTYWATATGSYVLCGLVLGEWGRMETRTSAVNGWEAEGASTG